MNILLDTQSAIWYFDGNPMLTKDMTKAIENPKNKKFLSIASIWEMAIKINIGKFELSTDLGDWVSHVLSYGIQVLPIEVNHLFILTNLPLHHRDPFDRIIISQAIAEQFGIVTSDHAFSMYPVNVIS